MLTKIHRSRALYLAFMTAILSTAAAPLPAADASGLLLVANKTDRTLGVIDPARHKQVATIAEDGVTGHEVAASPDGKFAYVPIFGDSGVGLPGSDGRILRVIDLEKHAMCGTVDFGKGVRPHCAVFHPAEGLLYVTTELDNSVTIIDPRTLKVIGAVPTGQPDSHMLAVTRDGRWGYTANVGTGTVSVLDLKTRALEGIIPVAARIQRIALSADDRWIFTSDQDKPRLAVIDRLSKRVEQWIDLPAKGYGAAATPDNRWLLIAIPGASKVGVIDLRTLKLTRTLDVPKAPQEVLVRPDGAFAYVSCDRAGQVAAIDLAKWTVAELIDAGAGADGLAWAPRR